VLLASHVAALPILPFTTSCHAVFNALQPLGISLNDFQVIIAHTGFSTMNSLHIFESSHIAQRVHIAVLPNHSRL